MPIDESFLGTGWSFPPVFSQASKDVQRVGEDDDILQSLYILFSTTPGERVLQPTYGCNLKAMVFENVTENTMTEIRDIIEKAVLFFEPRIDLNSVDVDTEQIKNGILRILLNYTVRATNTRSNMVYPFYFREGTNIQM